MFCPNCGKDNGPGYKFCAECGTDLTPGAALLSSPSKPADAPPGAAPPAGGRTAPPTDPGPPPPPPTLTGGGWSPTPPPPPSPPGGGFPPGPGTTGGWSSPGPSLPSTPLGGGPGEPWSPSPSPGYPTPSGASGGRFPLPLVIIAAVVLVLLVGFGIHRMRSGKTSASPTPAATATSATAPTAPGTPPPPSSPRATTPSGTSGAVTVLDVVLCKGFSRLRGAPVDRTKVFKPNETLRCAVRLGNVHTGMGVTGAWKGPGCDTKTPLTTDRFGTWVGRFEATPPSGAWQAGRYTFTLVVDGTEVRTEEFEVAGTGVSAPSTPSTAQTGAASGTIQEVTLCKSIGSDFKPVDPTSVFGASDTFRCVVTVKDAKAGQTIQSRWYQGDRHLTQVVYPVKSNGSGHVKFELPPRGSWSPGPYRVEVLVDGTLGRSATFEVR